MDLPAVDQFQEKDMWRSVTFVILSEVGGIAWRSRHAVEGPLPARALLGTSEAFSPGSVRRVPSKRAGKTP